MEYILLFLILGLILVLTLVSAKVPNTRPICDVHTWNYLEHGGMQCTKCLFIAGTGEGEEV